MFIHNIFCITSNKILQLFYYYYTYILLYISDSLKEAKEKAKRAQLTSDLSSADEQPKRSYGSAKKKYVPPPTFSENSGNSQLLLTKCWIYYKLNILFYILDADSDKTFSPRGNHDCNSIV